MQRCVACSLILQCNVVWLEFCASMLGWVAWCRVLRRNVELLVELCSEVLWCKDMWHDDLCIDATMCGLFTCTSMKGWVAWRLVLSCKVVCLDDLCFDARLCGLMTCASMQCWGACWVVLGGALMQRCVARWLVLLWMQRCVPWWLMLSCKIVCLEDLCFDWPYVAWLVVLCFDELFDATLRCLLTCARRCFYVWLCGLLSCA